MPSLFLDKAGYILVAALLLGISTPLVRLLYLALIPSLSAAGYTWVAMVFFWWSFGRERNFWANHASGEEISRGWHARSLQGESSHLSCS